MTSGARALGPGPALRPVTSSPAEGTRLVSNEIESPPSSAIDPAAVVGHVHLKVADLQRSIRFYSDALGFEVTQRMGDDAAFLGAGGYHHHVGLDTWES
ncbi:MAG TPA: hypothetical protein DCF71_13035, partial [Gemmatimonadetes bacterium]|nr:hypothetical protein [Gemmatimonadota bacterium]